MTAPRVIASPVCEAIPKRSETFSCATRSPRRVAPRDDSRSVIARLVGRSNPDAVAAALLPCDAHARASISAHATLLHHASPLLRFVFQVSCKLLRRARHGIEPAVCEFLNFFGA